jgi:hypothetical protein
MSFTEDMTAYFSVGEFASTATLDGLPIAAIFDAAYAQGQVGTFGMASSQPSLTLSTTSVPANPVGMPVVIKGLDYLVASHEPDGTGVSRLLLELVA